MLQSVKVAGLTKIYCVLSYLYQITSRPMELTKEYFDEQLKKLASKDDLLRFATKDDLLELATKTDLNSARDDIAEVKELVKRIDRRTDEDHRAALRDVEDLKRRVSVLEKSAAS